MAGHAAEQSEPVISARDIGVKFSIYGARQSMKQRLVNRFFRPKVSFWALHNMTFDVYHGEAFFVIGRNGAGKTTLLKVMAETLFPDTGTLTIFGEVTGFLSMGLGFRQDLSGHDNVELSLKLMGVPGREIRGLQSEIAEFTQLGMFLDAPVSRYSSGMRARLAFAIATSITTEILIMDEVINAGDEEFKGKCQARLDDMLAKAKAVVICTHNLQNAQTMASRVMWIEQGELMGIGEPKEMVGEYREFVRTVQADPLYDLKASQRRLVRPA